MKRLSVLAAIGLCFSVAHAEDWPQWLGPRRDGTSADKGLIEAFPKEGPKRLWQRDIGEGYSAPVVSGGKLVLFHRVADEEVVACLDAASGKELWKFAYPTSYEDALSKGDGPRATPTIVGNKVVTLGAEGTLHCLALDDGKKLWSRSLTREFKTPLGYFGISTSPVVDQNLVLVNVGGKDIGIAAFELDTGKLAWKATRDALSYSSPTVCTVDGRRLAVFFTATGAVVLDAKTGSVLFQKDWRARYKESANVATPLIIGDLAFFSASYETGALLLRLKKDGADEVWSGEDIMSNHYNTSVHRDGHLYGFHGRQEAKASFRCVELKTKKVKWDERRFGCGSIIVADSKLIVLTENGDLVLAKATPDAYRELAKTRLFESGPCRAHMALANGRLYARDQKKLVCVDLAK